MADPVAERLETFFQRYVEMGPGRNLAAIARESQVSILVVSRHATLYGWEKRANALLKPKREPVEGPVLPQAVAAVNTKQTEVAEQLIQKAQDFFTRNPIDRPQDAIKALQLGMELLRQASGADDATTNDLANILEARFKQVLADMKGAPPPQKVVLTPVDPEQPQIAAAPLIAEGEYTLDETFLEESGRSVPPDIEGGA